MSLLLNEMPLSLRLMKIKDMILTAKVMWIEAEKLKNKIEANERLHGVIGLLEQEINFIQNMERLNENA